MKKRYALVFGGLGQDGHYLEKILAREGLTPILLGRKNGDVGNQLQVDTIVSTTQPEYIFHFAADSNTAHDSIFDNQDAIVNGTTNILEAVKDHCPKCRVFLAGSILQFDDNKPIDHMSSFFAFDSAYAAQRHAMTAIGRYYRKLDIPVYIGYFGHHDSPRRTEQYLAMRIAQAAKRIAAGSKENIILRDPMDRKEWNFAGDFMEAVWILVNSTVYEAVIGTGRTMTISGFAELCLKEAGYVGPQRWTPDWTTATPRVAVTNPKIMAHLGWKPQVNEQELARMLVAS